MSRGSSAGEAHPPRINGILRARVEPLREIEALAEFDGRGPGTDAERRAAEHLADRLGEMGRDVEIEAIRVFPNWASTHALFAVLMVAASIVSVSYPFYCALAAVVIAALAILDVAGSFHSLRRLTGRRSSQNVFSKEGDEEKDGVIVLVAHYDTNRTGLPFGRRVTERWATLSQRLGTPVGPFQPYVISLMVIMVCTIVRMFGIQNLLVSVVQFLFTVNLIVHVPALVDIAMSPFVRGANNNASGVAAVLRLAERYGGQLDHFNVWVLFAGAGEGRQLGMADWLKAHRGDLNPETTIFICIDKAGTGTVRWHTREGYVTTVPFHGTLTEYCEEIAEENERQHKKAEEEDEESGGDDDDEGRERPSARYNARGVPRRTVSEGHLARGQQFPAITISSLNALDYSPYNHADEDTADRVDEQAMERVYGFTCRLLEMIDERVGEEFEKAGEETVLAEDE